MELAVLNGAFLLAKPVEGHSSLIWTERFGSNGDFSRESYDVGGTLSALPIDTFVSLRDSTVPMLVEDHKIDKSPDGPKITTTGRTVETVLTRRTTVHAPLGGGAPIAPWTSVQKTAVDAAYDVMNQVVTLGLANVADKIPQINIKPPIRPSGYVVPSSNQNYQVDPGELYSWVAEQIQADGYSLRAVRPSTPATTTMAIEIYTGVDRTKDVIFDARFDQFDSSAYLLSKTGLKNVNQVTGAQDSLEVMSGTAPTGLDRRVTYLDATQLAVGAPGATLSNIMKNLGTVDLAKMLETVLFSGEVSRLVGNQYGKDFFLGDTVKLTGDYGLSQFVQVAEFIRSEDNSGEKAYPTFASV